MRVFQAETPFDPPVITDDQHRAECAATEAYYRTLDRKLIGRLFTEDLQAPKDSGGAWRRWMHRSSGYSVLLSVGLWEGDRKAWLHVSLAHPTRLPTYQELTDVKRIFVGGRRQALQVFPPDHRHISLHPNCLHLWACLSPEGDGLPDFGAAGTI